MWILRTTGGHQPERTFRILPGGVRTIGRATGADFIVAANVVPPVGAVEQAANAAVESARSAAELAAVPAALTPLQVKQEPPASA